MSGDRVTRDGRVFRGGVEIGRVGRVKGRWWAQPASVITDLPVHYRRQSDAVIALYRFADQKDPS